MSRVVVWVYRLLDGRLLGRTLLLLTTRGRKSGLPRTTALHYQVHRGDVVVCASNAGRKTLPAWFFNLKADPHVRVQRARNHYSSVAEELKDADSWAAWIARDPGYGRMAGPGNRYPLVRLRPDQKPVPSNS